ncbi:MAB_1171c family putative transporter [Microbacterium profundi]|uniref:MAB_1171c family putative transporter n=1 Tax=Microbacterium profundi TaxID=450380 RepID=A0ABV3LFC9_9MICO
MIQTLVATLMWALVASLLIFRRKRADRSITYAAITIAIAMSLNVDAIYATADALLGGTNIATLIADALLMTGLFFLGRGVMRTGEYRPRLVRAVVSMPVLVASLFAITVAFLFIDRGTTTTQFMNDLGDEPPAAAYSIINFAYCLVVIAAMLTLASRQFRHSTGIQRLPAGLLTLGSAFGVALCVAVIVMDIAHVTDQLDLMHAVQPAYGPLSLLTFLFLCAGFAVQPAVRRAQHCLRGKRTAALAADLEPLWHRATSVRPGLSQADPLATSADDAEGRLHREIVEIRDAMIDRRITFDTNPTEVALLERAESHLLGHDQAASVSTSDDEDGAP